MQNHILSLSEVVVNNKVQITFLNKRLFILFLQNQYKTGIGIIMAHLPITKASN